MSIYLNIESCVASYQHTNNNWEKKNIRKAIFFSYNCFYLACSGFEEIDLSMRSDRNVLF